MITNKSKDNRKPRKRSFTLIEILVSLAVFGLLMPAIGLAFYNIYRDWQRQKAYIEAMTNAQWTVELMAQEIRQAILFDIQTSDPNIWRTRVSTPATGSNDHIWYWRGDQTLQQESNVFGYRGYIYRALTSQDYFWTWQWIWWPFYGYYIYWPYNYRHQLSSFVVDNPSGNSLIRQDALDSNLIIIELTVRPKPDSPVGHNNRNFTIKTQIRLRNFKN